jgi:AraC family transcriptional regulator
MLREGSVPLARIALDLGFSSQSHFTRLFSSHTGMAPQQFRRQQTRMNE